MPVARVIATVTIEGFHYWPDAAGPVDFLSVRHRHRFLVRAEMPVCHDDRDVEFITLGRQVCGHLTRLHGDPCEFGAMSCEMIARELVAALGLSACEVWEDGENGARVECE